jgi:hypothetical protein
MRAPMFLFVVVGLISGLAAGQTPRSALPDVDQANTLLGRAEFYVQLREYDNAQKDIAEALRVAVGNTEVISRAKRVSQRILDETATKQKEEQARARMQYLSQLAEAERLSAHGKYDKASEIAFSVLKATNDSDLVLKANGILEKNRPTTLGLLNTLPDRFLTILAWALDFVLSVVVIVLLYVLLLLLRLGWTAWQNREQGTAGRRWLVRPIDDTTKLSVAEIITMSMNRWSEKRAPASAGLLKLENLQIPTVLQLQLPQVQVDLAPALEGLSLQVGAINIPAIGKAIGIVKTWFNAKRVSIIGSATLVDSRVVVRLTRIDSSGTSQTVTAAAVKTDSETAAEAASYKMYYLIAQDSSVSEAEGADKLRAGLKLLGEYLKGDGHQRLEDAFRAFENVRQQAPDFYEAYLYEAIALDLLERHDEAIKRFLYLIQNATDEKLLQKARYNLAVSRFRKYDPEALDLAIEELDELIKVDPASSSGVQELFNSPIKSLALAAKANAIAHKPIFWKRYRNLSANLGEQEFLKYKKFAKAELDQWMVEVKTISNTLKEVSEDVKHQLEKAKGKEAETETLSDAATRTHSNASEHAAETAKHEREKVKDKTAKAVTPWDPTALTQLEWAIENANGNIYLNYAKSFLGPPHVPKSNEPELRAQYLTEAYDAFRRCEMLLPPGVETLTNLATTLLDLDRSEEARDYLQKARDMNPYYEYGYFRTAEAWEQEGRVDEVLKLLRDFVKVKEPKIPSFRAVYEKYAIELAK